MRINIKNKTHQINLIIKFLIIKLSQFHKETNQLVWILSRTSLIKVIIL